MSASQCKTIKRGHHLVCWSRQPWSRHLPDRSAITPHQKSEELREVSGLTFEFVVDSSVVEARGYYMTCDKGECRISSQVKDVPVMYNQPYNSLDATG